MRNCTGNCTTHWHDWRCPNFPRKAPTFIPDAAALEDANNGIGTVRFHQRGGFSFELKKVQYDTIGGDPNGHKNDTTGDFENGDLFHVPNVMWWEVV